MVSTSNSLKIPLRLFPSNPTPEQLRDIAYATTEALKRKMRNPECPEEWKVMAWDFLFEGLTPIH